MEENILEQEEEEQKQEQEQEQEQDKEQEEQSEEGQIQETQKDEKDIIIENLQNEINYLNKSFVTEMELLKNDVKNITATKALLNIDIDLDEDAFLENIKGQIEDLKKSEESSFLFKKKEENIFKGIEVKKNETKIKSNKTIKDGIKNYFNI